MDEGGTYNLSVWLGDWETDYDAKPDILSFEWKSGQQHLKAPNPENLGYIEAECKWECEQ